MRPTKSSCFATIVILFTWCACQPPEPNPSLSLSKFSAPEETLDTLNTKGYNPVAKPVVFETAFFKGSNILVDSVNTPFYAINIGDILIESGKMIACDPIVAHDASPFKDSFPTGYFPVQLAIARFENDQRVAFARILFSEQPVTRWEFALKDGQKPKSIYDSTFYAYGVDAGIGMFIDSVANAVLTESTAASEKLFPELERTSRSPSHTVYNFEAHNLAAFSTGWGDGHYATYIGYDANGRICRLLTDFNLVDWLSNK